MLTTSLFYSTIQTSNMYGGGYEQYGGCMEEMRSDMWIERNIPGGLNSAPGVGGYGGGNGCGGGYPMKKYSS
ncbi:unnamed protein product [Rotaria magnacalcarata]